MRNYTPEETKIIVIAGTCGMILAALLVIGYFLFKSSSRRHKGDEIDLSAKDFYRDHEIREPARRDIVTLAEDIYK